MGQPACRCAPRTKLDTEGAARVPCGSCGTVGKPVGPLTLALHIKGTAPPARVAYRFCETPDCPVVYYGRAGSPSYRTEDLRTRVGVKETEDPVPVCYCFSFTERQVIEDLLAHGRSTIREYIRQKVREGECACERTNPSGRCCLGNVGRAIAKASLLATPGEAARATHAGDG